MTCEQMARGTVTVGCCRGRSGSGSPPRRRSGCGHSRLRRPRAFSGSGLVDLQRHRLYGDGRLVSGFAVGCVQDRVEQLIASTQHRDVARVRWRYADRHPTPAHHRDDAITADWSPRSGQYRGDALTDGYGETGRGHEAGVGSSQHTHRDTDRPHRLANQPQPGGEPTIRRSRLAVGHIHERVWHDHRGHAQTLGGDGTVDQYNRVRGGRFCRKANPPGFARRGGRSADETCGRAR